MIRVELKNKLATSNFYYRIVTDTWVKVVIEDALRIQHALAGFPRTGRNHIWREWRQTVKIGPL